MTPVGLMEALDGQLPPLVAQVRFLSDTSFLIERLMVPADTPRAYSFTVPSRIVLWHHVGDLWPFDGITKEKRPAGTGTQTQDSELVYPLGHRLPIYISTKYH